MTTKLYDNTNLYDLDINLEAIIVRIDGHLYSMNLEHHTTAHLTPNLRLVSQSDIDLGGFVLIENYEEPELSESKPLST